MYTLRLMLCLAMLAPCVGLAQMDELPPPPLVPAPTEPEQAPPEAELIPHEFEPSVPPGETFSAARVMLEFVGGGVAGGGLGFVSLLAGAVIFSGACSGDDLSCLGPIFFTGIVGAAVGVPLGVYGAGKLLKGQGAYWPSLIGTVVGAGIGLTVGLISQNEPALVMGVTAGPVVGAIVGYELSHAAALSSLEREDRGSGTSVQVTPAFGLTPGGLYGALAGRF